MEEAIKKAIEAGYKAPFGKPYKTNHYRTKPEGLNLTAISQDLNIHAVLLDPAFWQALGKAMGWLTEGHQWSTGGQRCDCCGAWDDDMTPPGAYDYCWKYHWHLFIDYLSEGKDPETFFNQLLQHE